MLLRDGRRARCGGPFFGFWRRCGGGEARLLLSRSTPWADPVRGWRRGRATSLRCDGREQKKTCSCTYKRLSSMMMRRRMLMRRTITRPACKPRDPLPRPRRGHHEPDQDSKTPILSACHCRRSCSGETPQRGTDGSQPTMHRAAHGPRARAISIENSRESWGGPLENLQDARIPPR